MPKTPKAKVKSEEKKTREDEGLSLADDQRERGYYYDDSHGYEVYEPDKDEKEESD